jgi:lipoprotein-releasing system ATP-binding protein
LRRTEIGFVYQFHQLLPEFSALENVMLPQLIMGRSRRAAEKRATALLTSLGLADRAEHRPAELSGGEQQRAAICRGLANAPKLLLADEPTGNLDPYTSEHVFRELIELIRHQGVAALIATHNVELARRMDRVLAVQDGRLIELVPTQAAARRV